MAGMIGAIGSIMGSSGGAGTGAAAGGAMKGGATGAAKAPSALPTNNTPGSYNPDSPMGSNLVANDSIGMPLKQAPPKTSTMDAINAYINSPEHQHMMQQNQDQMQRRNSAMGFQT